MKKTRKIIKTMIFSFIILCLLFTIFPTVNAGIGDKLKEAYTCNLIIDTTFNKTIANDPLLPVDRVKEIPVYISTDLSGFYLDDMWYWDIENQKTASHDH